MIRTFFLFFEFLLNDFVFYLEYLYISVVSIKSRLLTGVYALCILKKS